MVREGWNGFGVIHTAAARMGTLMLGFAQQGGIADVIAAAPKLAFFLGADEVDFAKFAGSFKVYVGHHGDAGAHHADVILPGATYAEKPGTYVNLEGRVQRGDRAVFPPRRRARGLDDPARAVRSARPHAAVRQFRRAARRDGRRHAGAGGGRLVKFDWAPPALAAEASGEIAYPIKDFYLTNAICRASPTMQRCSAELVHGQDFAEAAE